MVISIKIGEVFRPKFQHLSMDEPFVNLLPQVFPTFLRKLVRTKTCFEFAVPTALELRLSFAEI